MRGSRSTQLCADAYTDLYKGAAERFGHMRDLEASCKL